MAAESGRGARYGAGAQSRPSRATGATPPSPTLPPSRGKGVFEHAAHAPGAVKRARTLRQRMPAGERKLWKVLRTLKLGIRRQAPIGPYIVDFAHHSASLVIEVDGPRHDEPEAQLRDLERDAWLKSQGYRVLRFSSREAFEYPYGIADQVVALVRHPKALLLDGGGLGGGVAAESGREALDGAGAQSRSSRATVATPPSPALPPLRRKGE
ncbi:MAG: DUF559 domain-containing protein [Caulobacter sp.]|nr:DUF559 domain-containing protein [Caulobacter sp.]